MDLIKPFTAITVHDVPVVGGKGANLGEMTRAGLPVPPGFCLTADAYRRFVAPVQPELERILATAQMDNPEQVEQSTARLREFLIAQPAPQDISDRLRAAYAELTHALGAGERALPVAVRSSATAEDLPDASFAGQQDTYLNVRGEAALLEHVKRCWASLWTARAVTYRHKQGYPHDQVALAVVVQAMLESEVAGILFTANPVNRNRAEMVLNASWGLGEAVVSGLVTPDTWVLLKSGEILERAIAVKQVAIEYAASGGTREVPLAPPKSEQPCLNDAEIRAVGALGVKVEAHYARPMDIEWGYRGGKFYMLQARPITTLAAPTDAAPGEQGNEADARADSADRAVTAADASSGEYNRTMFVEIFPESLSPAFLSVIVPLFKSMLDFTFETLGFAPPRGIPAIGEFYNQPYFHREYIQAAFAPLSPPVRAALVAQITNPFGKHARKLPAEGSPAYLGMVTRLLRFMTAFPKQLPELLDAYRRQINEFCALPFERLSDKQLMAQLRELIFKRASHLLNYDFLMIALIGITYQMLGSMLERYYGDESDGVRARLVSGVTGNVTMETNKKLWDLAQEAKQSATVSAVLRASSDAELRARLAESGDGRIFLAELDAFLERYGHREIRMDILYPTWGEDPTPVLQFVRGYLDVGEENSPHRQQERLAREREQLAREVRARLNHDLRGRFAVTPFFGWVLENSQAHTRERDTMHFELTRLFPPLRRALLELGGRWQARGLLDSAQDVFFLTLDQMQVMADAPQPMQSIVAASRAEYQANARRTPPPIVRDGVGVETAAVAAATADGELHGIAGSPGVVTGTVRVVHGPEEFDKLKRGEILVAPFTNPVWTPLFAIAGGIITQVGGILSHGAIVAREYGIPAVMAVQNATALLSDGEQVTVDGSRGLVRKEGMDNIS